MREVQGLGRRFRIITANPLVGHITWPGGVDPAGIVNTGRLATITRQLWRGIQGQTSHSEWRLRRHCGAHHNREYDCPLCDFHSASISKVEDRNKQMFDPDKATSAVRQPGAKAGHQCESVGVLQALQPALFSTVEFPRSCGRM